MEILVILVLVMASILIVGYPLVKQDEYRDRWSSRDGEPAYDELYTQRETVFDALRDMQFEHATGKLSTQDYDQLRTRYENEAVQVMQQIDALKPKGSRAAQAQGTSTCPRCGASQGARDKFCTRCGAKL